MSSPTEEFYAAELVKLNRKLATTLAREIAAGRTSGPYGAYPPGPLAAEAKAGLEFRVSPPARAFFGEHLAAGLDHAHLLVSHPRDASPAALQVLLGAGWSTTGIVTLSQLASLLAFQIRVVAGLRAPSMSGSRASSMK